MNVVCLNVRGVGGFGKDIAINKLVSESKPVFLDLVETKHSLISEHKIAKWWYSRSYGWQRSKQRKGVMG